MADAVAARTILDGPKNVAVTFLNISDGTGESGAVKIDVSSLSPPPAGLAIERIVYSLSGMGLDMYWGDGSHAAHLPQDQSGEMDFTKFGGILGNGDLKFTTVKATPGTRYMIVVHARKRF